jgi:hypothetical protein
MTEWDSLKEFVREAYNPHGLPGLDAKLLIQPYSYPLEFNSLAPAGQSSQQLVIAANADFVLSSLRYRASLYSNGGADDTDADIVPKVRVLITDTGSNQQFSSQSVDIANLFGQIGRAPYVYMFPRIINGRSALTVAVTSYAVADTYANIELSFAGALVQQFGS